MISSSSLFICENYINPMQHYAHLEEEKLNLFIPLSLLLNHHAFPITQLA
jgi:hypothetical protein